jgi:hypothetical protein
MVRARAASQMAVSIPFGAAHRVNFDTPPLEGRCLAPFGAIWRCAEFVRLTKFAVPVGAR